MSKLFDSQWLRNHEARQRGSFSPTLSEHPGTTDPEGTLRKAILREIEARGWFACYSPPNEPTNRMRGEVDLYVYADRGRLFLIELKTKTGKLSEEQRDFHFWATKLGHAPYVVRSFEQFIDLIK